MKKKRSLKKLNLEKVVISSFDSSNIIGGSNLAVCESEAISICADCNWSRVPEDSWLCPQ